MKNYTQHRYECLVCRKFGVLVPENWITGVCKFCASNMILPIKDIKVDQNIIHFPVAKKFHFPVANPDNYSLELKNRALKRSNKMEMVKSLESLVELVMNKQFGEQIKQNMFGNIRQFNAMQLDMAKYRNTGNMGMLNKFLSHLKGTISGLESLEETSTHYLFTQRVSQSGTLTYAMDKKEIETCIEQLRDLL